MNMYKNFLSEDNYLIKDDLHELLSNPRPSVNSDGSSMNKNEEGVYLVRAKILNNNSNVIIYNYLYYPLILYESLVYHVISKRDFNNSLIYGEWGDFLTIFDSNLCKDGVVGDNKLVLNSTNSYLIKALASRGTLEYKIGDYHELFLYINKLIYLADSSTTANLIDLAFRQDYKSFSALIFDNKTEYTVGNNTLRWGKINDEESRFDILTGCLFVIRNLENFVSNLKHKGYVVNTGPQKWRGQMNSMANFLIIYDMDYRNSLYRHNQYHVYKDSIDPRFALSKSKFSFKNIHQNLRGVRWHSSNTTSFLEKQKLRVSKSKVINTSLLGDKKNKSLRENSPIYSYLNQWLAKSPINETTQRALEQYLLDYTYISLDSRDDNPLIDYSLISSRLKRLLVDKKESLIKIINNFRGIIININKKRINQKDKSQYYLNLLLKEMDNEDVIAIIYGRLMRIISRYNRFYSDDGPLDILHSITDDFIRNYFFSLYIKYIYNIHIENPAHNMEINKKLTSYEKKRARMNIEWELKKKYTLSDWKRDNKDLVEVFKDPTLKTYIGGIIIEWMIVSNLIQSETIMLSKKDKNTIYVPTEEILNTLGTKSLVNLPFRIPMVVKPHPYYREVIDGSVIERLGGYLLNDYKTSDSLIIDNWELKESSTIKDENVVYDLVNNMNSVGYKINKDVLNFLDNYGVEYDLILHKESPLLNKPNLRKMEKIQLESYQNKVELQENILGLARVYSQIHEFYLPVRIDFRGRMYCISEYLNYQSTELAKSLLLYSNPEKIKKTDSIAISYLKAFGANCFGNKLDKKSWNERTKWIDDNIRDIINFENGKLIKQASNKLLFIAFCFEYNRWLSSLNNVNSTYFETYLPIQLDATCNGYQHLSLLSLDLSLAKELNLTTSTWDDLPKDFYNYLSTNLIDLFINKLSSKDLNEEQREDYIRLSVLDIARAIVKKAIMTIPYNVSTHQMIKYIRENFELSDEEVNKDIKPKDKLYQFIDDSSIKLKYRDFTTIGLGLREVLNNNFFKLKELMKYLKQTAKICTKLDLAIPWGLPSGLLPKQSYLATDEVRLKPFSYNKSKFIVKIPNREKYNSKKQIRAFMPNLVHSLDAVSLALLVDMYFNNSRGDIKNIYAIHDCFAVTANNVENLMELLKLVYIKIYSEGKYLKQLDDEIRHQIIVYYGKDAFTSDNLTVKVEGLPKMQYPDIKEVLGINLPGANLDPKVLKSSSYLIN